jgi:soluble lytic murein transglycosylase-like protein
MAEAAPATKTGSGAPVTIPDKICTAVAPSGSPGRPSGRRASASPLTVASTMAALRSLIMLLCILVILAASMLSSGAAHAEQESSATRRPNDSSVRPFAAFVAEASKRFGVPEHWIRAVMHAESSAKQRARSSKGAMGLMQIMPKTWTELRARYGLGADPYDPRDNILAGAAYIRELYDRYGAPGFWRPTMQDLDATNVIWRRVGRRRMRRKRTSRHSHR